MFSIKNIVDYGDSSIVLKILSYGPKICKLNHLNDKGNTGLMIAINFEENEAALNMLKYGVQNCNLNNKNIKGETALDIAVKTKNKKIEYRIKELLNINVLDVPE